MENEKNLTPAEETAVEPVTEASEIAEEATVEPLEPAKFVVKTTLCAESQLEASKKLVPKVTQYISFVGIGLIVVLLGLTIWQYVTTKATDRLYMAGLLVLVLAFFVYSRLSNDKRALKRWESDLQRRYHSNALHLTTEFFDHSLAQSVEECDDLIVEGYSKISELRETEHLLLLRCSARQWFFLAKDGFETGSVDDFRTFIQAKIGEK